jgi:hypothetical protein
MPAADLYRPITLLPGRFVVSVKISWRTQIVAYDDDSVIPAKAGIQTLSRQSGF